jgi:hypothetical protein
VSCGTQMDRALSVILSDNVMGRSFVSPFFLLTYLYVSTVTFLCMLNFTCVHILHILSVMC